MNILSPLPQHLILFDSQCNLCNGWSRFVLKRDTAQLFTFCRVQSPAGQQLLQQLGLPLDYFESVIYLRTENKRSIGYHRSEAAVQIFSLLPYPWKLLALLRYCPRLLRDTLYNLIARNRYRLFGQPEQCRLADEPYRSRFLEESSND